MFLMAFHAKCVCATCNVNAWFVSNGQLIHIILKNNTSFFSFCGAEGLMAFLLELPLEVAKPQILGVQPGRKRRLPVLSNKHEIERIKKYS